jgi:hypothetical protein
MTMWSFEALWNHRRWTATDIPSTIKALIPELDLACLADDGGLHRPGTGGHGLALHLLHEATYDWPAPDTLEWVQAAIATNPGIWISRLCRAKHGLRENLRSVVYCGQCAGGYANPRRRRRAAALPKEVLPGFEEIGGPHQLHAPCSRQDLPLRAEAQDEAWLRYLIYRLVRQGQVVKVREKRPDLLQPRDWDIMTCLYPNHELQEKGFPDVNQKTNATKTLTTP